MRKNNILCIIITAIFCFSQTIEVNAKLWACRSQESIFVTMDTQKKNILVQGTDSAFTTTSDQSAQEDNKFTIREKVKTITFATIAAFLGVFALKTITVLKKWVDLRFSQAFYNWQSSLFNE
ncbi:hypothetical protein [Bartonella pachyuromydis]|uniref:Uncharacterized protein n=1 Tax=Bartonella pachyuromydis TaxID=931097 RepID=A0ABP8VGF0_9HYPH